MRNPLTRRPALVAVLASLGVASSAHAAGVPLGTADSFAVLAASTVTNTGPTTISGDLGLSPGTSVTGFPPGTVSNGTMHVADAAAQGAQDDLTIAYNDAAGRASTAAITSDLAGQTLTTGVYTSASSVGLTGDLTLDAQGDPDALFLLRAGSTLTVGSGSRVLLVNGAQACNVFWQVGSSATLGTNATFVGSILAQASISLTTGASLDGRALARSGAVTMDTNQVARSACAAGTGTGTGTGTDGGGTTTPGGGGDTPTTGGGGPGTPGDDTTTGGGANPPTRLTGPPSCVKAPFWARVRGADIARVRFFVDGVLRRTVYAKTGRTVFVLFIRTMRQDYGMHRVRARVRFTAASGKAPRTLRLVYQRCASVAAVTPQFTG